jgi:hypothetical protein
VRVGFFEKTLLLFFNSVNIYQQPNFKSWNVPRIRRENFCEFFIQNFPRNKIFLTFTKKIWIFLEKMVVVKLIVIVLVLLFRLSVVDSDASSSVIQRLIVRLEDPSSDNGTLFKQIEVRFF